MSATLAVMCRLLLTAVLIGVSTLVGSGLAIARTGESANTAAQSADARVVGFERVRINNGSEAPLSGGIWYPTSHQYPAHGGPWPGVITNAAVEGDHLPMIVLSHGGGSSYEALYDTAIALARAGFVAAAVNHAGDTVGDESRVLELWRRPAQLHRLITYMLDEWPEHGALDPEKVGAFGFSNGGFTVLVAAGGVPNLARIGPYCGAHPDHDLCVALRQHGLDPTNPGIRVPKNAWVADSRIKAAVIAAPAFGFAFDRRGLSRVRVPIQLWRAADDRHQPNPYYEEALRERLPRAPEYRVIPGAGHFDFLPPCDARLAAAVPAICSDAPGFSRADFHVRLNVQIVRFFRMKLDD